jgi:transcriptional antiterminator RfaH
MTWAVVQCEAQRERTVEHLLKCWHFEVYLPRIKLKNRIVALFPGYLFARLGDRIYQVMWCPHVIRLLWEPAPDGCIFPAKIDDRIIVELQKRERNGLVKLPQPPRLRRGQRVRVTSGPMQGQLGIYEGMTSKDRERVLLDLLGRQVRIELSAKHLEPITAGDVSRKAS